MRGSTKNDTNLKEELVANTTALCRIPGAPGFEHDVVDWLTDQLQPYVDEMEVEPMGNLYAQLRGAESGPSLMISAHSDEIGAVVRAIEPNGFLRFNKLD